MIPTKQNKLDWRRDLIIAAALLHAVHESMVFHNGDAAHIKSLRLMVKRLDEMRTQT